MAQSVALYRKYRSQSLAEVVGQEHITDNLAAAIKKQQISHAYLFTGPHGTGKTSTARIMARQINGLKDDDDGSYLDIVEIDAASHNGVDDVRELRESVITVPTELDYKVYIIDEVHMLSQGAFNALLKTLEEPPEHAVFILATTEIHKLPATIISRTQRYNFRPPSTKVLADHLADIAKQEGLKLSPEALELIAENGAGSFRDAISLLDQVANQAGKKSKVDRQQVEQVLGLATTDQINSIIEAVFTQGNPHQALAVIDDMINRGLSVSAVAAQLRGALRAQLVQDIDPLKLRVAHSLLAVESSKDQRLSLELALLDAISSDSSADQPQSADQSAVKTAPSSSPKPKVTTDSPVKSKASTPSKPEPKPEPAAVEATVLEADSDEDMADAEPILKDWSEIIAGLKEAQPSLYAVLRQAKVSAGSQPGQLNVSFRYKLHHRKASQPGKLKILKQLIEDRIGGTIELLMRHDSTPTTQTDEPSDNKLNSIHGLLGGEVVTLSE